MIIERSKSNPAFLHLAKTGESGRALCGEATGPTNIAVTAWGRVLAKETDARFCAHCDTLKDSVSKA